MPQEMFQVLAVDSARVVELSLPVSLDSGEFDSINEFLLEVVSKEPQMWWVLDLSRLSYMGSAALGLMVNVRQRVMRGGGKLVLCGMSAKLQQIFRTCCLERLFTIKASRADALKTLGIK
jgi:anti-sigma B factor antagonist